MIITPVTPKREKVLIPQPLPPNAKSQTNNRSVVLDVVAGPNKQVQLQINPQDVSWQDLSNRLVGIYKTRAQKVMFVKADDGIPWADVANVIDIAHSSGVDKVGLITSKIDNG
jgi:biopolymer transport protein TolR